VSWWLTAAHSMDRPRSTSTLHQLPDVVGEVEIARVFWRHDEPELVPLAEARLLEGLTGHGALGAVEHAGRAVLLDTVAFDVSKVPRSRLRAMATQLLHVRFDDDPAGARPRTEAGGWREPRLRLAAELPVTSAHEPRDAKRARGDAFARAIGPADPRSEGFEIVVGVVASAHR
jgi:hypothetical protein